MQSKTSFFNRAIFKKNMSRLWVVGTAYFIYLLFNVTFLYLNDNRYYEKWEVTTKYTPVYNLANALTRGCNGIGICLVVFASALLCFKYLFNRRDNFMIHALPVSRKSLYFTGLISMAVAIIIPIVLATLITIVVAAATGAGSPGFIIYWGFNQLAGFFIFTGIAMFSIMITGQWVTSIVFFVIFNLLYAMMDFVLKLVETTLMFGMENALNEFTLNFMTPLEHLSDAGVYYTTNYDAGNITAVSLEILEPQILVGYILVGIALIVVSYFIYKAKQLETVADFITVSWIKPIFTVGMSFFISIAAGAVVADLTNYNINRTANQSFAITLLVSLVIGAIIFFVCQMLIAKSARIFNMKNLVSCVIYSMAAVAVICCLKADAFGIENHVPSLNNVTSITFEANNSMSITDPEDMAKIIALNQEIVDNKAEIRRLYEQNRSLNDVDTMYIGFTYFSNSGKASYRTYRFVDPEDVETSDAYKKLVDDMLALANDPDNIKEYVIGSMWDDCTAVSADFSLISFNEQGDYYISYAETDVVDEADITAANAVYEALLKDIDAGAAYQTSFGSNTDIRLYNDLTISLKPNSGSYQNSDYYTTNSEYSYRYLYIELTTDCVNTLAALKEYGFYTSDDQIATYDQINEMDAEWDITY